MSETHKKSIPNYLEIAKHMRSMYLYECHFPEWVVSQPLWDTFNFADTNVYYEKGTPFKDILYLMKFREPCNISMNRFYDLNKMWTTFGYAYGAYALSTPQKIMPNIAVYCKATVSINKLIFQAHVINLIGIALDAPNQPDFIFYTSVEQMILRYSKMWFYAYKAAKDTNCKTLRIYDVGGGDLAGEHRGDFNERIFEPAFEPLLALFEEDGIVVEGYDWNAHVFCESNIAVDLLQSDLSNTMFVNSWNPWTLIGNGNTCENSLDGTWGRISNMSVLGWLLTNPHMRFKPVVPPTLHLTISSE